MTRVDFYVFDSATNPEHQTFVCRLTEKAWRQGHEVYILCEDRRTAVELDDRLWTYRDISFLPHSLVDDDTAAPVKIGYDETVPAINDVLVNLADRVPVFFSRFERVVETTGTDHEQRTRARDRYRYYQERGYALETHNIGDK